jgi:hypothetical protein
VGRAVLDRLKHASARAGFARIAPPIPAAVGPILLGAAIVAYNSGWVERLGVVATGRHESQYLTVSRWVGAHLPQGSGLVSMQMSGSLFHYTDFSIVRWDFIDGDTLRRLEPDSAAGRQPLYAVLHPFDFELRVRDHLQGRWLQVATIEDITIWRFDGLFGEDESPSPEARWVPLPDGMS